MNALLEAINRVALPTVGHAYNPKRVLLIDGDMLVYHACYTQQGTPSVGVAKKKCVNIINELLANSGAGKALLVLTSPSSPKCYRHLAAKTFPYQAKSSRGNRPECWYPIRQWIELYKTDTVSSKLVRYYEADDGIAMLTEQYGKGCNYDPDLVWVVSKDKDLRMVTGCTHIDWETSTITKVPKDSYHVVNTQSPTKPYGYYWFCYQMLAGDTVDSIAGCQGIGEANARKLLKDTKTIQEGIVKVQEAYITRYGADTYHRYFTEVAWLLWLRTQPHYDSFPEWLPLDGEYIKEMRQQIKDLNKIYQDLPIGDSNG